MNMLRAIAPISVLLLIGCTQPKQLEKTYRILLPPMPGAFVRSPEGVSRLAKLSETPQARVIISWQCPETPWSTNYATGIEASVDLANWAEVARLPYQPTNIITLTNRPPMEFYRAFSKIEL